MTPKQLRDAVWRFVEHDIGFLFRDAKRESPWKKAAKDLPPDNRPFIDDEELNESQPQGPARRR